MFGVGLQSVAKWITKCARDYKAWRGGLQSVAKWIQSALGITKCGMVDYKVCQGLQSEAGLQSELVHPGHNAEIRRT